MWRAATTPIQYVAILSLVLFSSLVIFLTPISSSGVSVASAETYFCYEKGFPEILECATGECGSSFFGGGAANCTEHESLSAAEATYGHPPGTPDPNPGINNPTTPANSDDNFIAEGFKAVLNAFFSTILTGIITLVGGLMAMAGFGFDSAISYSILNFSTNFNNNIKDGVDVVWGGFRDIANIIMIAMYVFVAFSVMLNISTYGLKTLGVRILVIALLINFSLFFTKAIIDISNRTAAEFNSAIKSPDGSPVRMADVFFSASGISTAGYEDITDNQVTGAYGTISGIDDIGAKFLYTFTLVILYSVLTAVFIYGMLLLMIRMVTLIILMFTSSLAFAAQLIPKYGQGWWNKWWGELVKNAIFAPLFMLMLWATVKIVTEFTKGREGGGEEVIASLAKGELGSWQYIMQMMIVIGLLYASIKVSSGLATFGGKFAQNMSMKGLGASLSIPGAAGNLAMKLPYLNRIQAKERFRKGVEKGRKGLQKLNLGTVGANLDNTLKKIGESSLSFADSKAAKELQKKSGIQLGFKAPSKEVQTEYDYRRGLAGGDSKLNTELNKLLNQGEGASGAPVRNAEGDQHVPPETDGATTPSESTAARESTDQNIADTARAVRELAQANSAGSKNQTMTMQSIKKSIDGHRKDEKFHKTAGDKDSEKNSRKAAEGLEKIRDSAIDAKFGGDKASSYLKDAAKRMKKKYNEGNVDSKLSDMESRLAKEIKKDKKSE